MKSYLRHAGLFLLVTVLVFSLSACGLKATPQPTVEPVKEVVVETAPPSPTPTPTPTPVVPSVEVTTVPMPMPSVSPTVSISNPVDPTAIGTDAAATATASPTVSPSPSASPSPTPTPYSADAAFASTITPDSVNIPANAKEGYISANDVNFRGGPSASARLIGTLKSGTRVSVLGTENGWTEIIANGTVGYVKSDYVSVGTYTGSSAPAVIVEGGSGDTMVIVPDGPVTGGQVTYVTPTPVGTDFLGIRPD